MLDLVALERSVLELQETPGGPEILRSVNQEIIQYLENKLRSLGIKPLPRYILPILRKRRAEAENCKKNSRLKNDPAFLQFLDDICADPQDSIAYKIRASFLLLERHLFEEFGIKGDFTLCGHCFKTRTRLRHTVLSRNQGIPICKSCFKVKVIELVSNGIPPVLLPSEKKKSAVSLRFRDTENFMDLEAFYLISRRT